MRNQLGSMIRKAREKIGLTRVAAARKVGISHYYFGHLERSAPVRLSDKLRDKLVTKLGVPKSISRMQDAHNKRASKYYKQYRKRNAA